MKEFWELRHLLWWQSYDVFLGRGGSSRVSAGDCGSPGFEPGAGAGLFFSFYLSAVWGGRHSAEVVFTLSTQPSRVRIWPLEKIEPTFL